MGMLPGVGKIKQQMADANIDDSILKRQQAIISSMTKKERRSPKLIDGKRRRRIAAGSGTKVEDVNKLIKMHRQMADMMKAMGKQRGMMSRLFGGPGAAWAAVAACQPDAGADRATEARRDPEGHADAGHAAGRTATGWPARTARRRRAEVSRTSRPAGQEEVKTVGWVKRGCESTGATQQFGANAGSRRTLSCALLDPAYENTKGNI